jgi:hypothetical protein
MTELISIKDVPKEVRIRILNELGYSHEDGFVLKNGERVLDKYTDEPIKLDRMIIVPGSVIILDNNPLSIALYLEEFGDVL